MRIYFHLSPNTEPVPFNYQRALVGAFHGWLGENEVVGPEAFKAHLRERIGKREM